MLQSIVGELLDDCVTGLTLSMIKETTVKETHLSQHTSSLISSSPTIMAMAQLIKMLPSPPRATLLYLAIYSSPTSPSLSFFDDDDTSSQSVGLLPLYDVTNLNIEQVSSKSVILRFGLGCGGCGGFGELHLTLWNKFVLHVTHEQLSQAKLSVLKVRQLSRMKVALPRCIFNCFRTMYIKLFWRLNEVGFKNREEVLVDMAVEGM